MTDPKKGGAGRTLEPRALTHRAIETLKPDGAPFRVPDARCIGLAIRVAVDGRKTWDFSFRIKGAPSARRVSLGVFDELGLDSARDRANELRRNGRGGVDLLADETTARRAKAAADARITIDQLIARYMADKASKLRSRKEIESRLRRGLAPILHKPAEDVVRRDVRPLFDLVMKQELPREAEKRRQTAGAMFRWALSRDLVTIDPTAGIEPYPAAALKARVLSEDEIHKLWGWLPKSAYPADHAEVLRLELALGARCGELAGIAVEEVDSDNWIWRLPPERSKNGKERITPLVGIAREIVDRKLRQISRGPLFVTESGKPLRSDNVGASLHHRRGKLPIADFTTHDLRRTTASMLAEMGISFDTIAIVVGHDAGNRQTRTLIRHYVRSDFLDRKRAALEAWDARLRSILQGTHKPTNVVPIRA